MRDSRRVRNSSCLSFLRCYCNVFRAAKQEESAILFACRVNCARFHALPCRRSGRLPPVILSEESNGSADAL